MAQLERKQYINTTKGNAETSSDTLELCSFSKLKGRINIRRYSLNVYNFQHVLA